MFGKLLHDKMASRNLRQKF